MFTSSDKAFKQPYGLAISVNEGGSGVTLIKSFKKKKANKRGTLTAAHCTQNTLILMMHNDVDCGLMSENTM